MMILCIIIMSLCLMVFCLIVINNCTASKKTETKKVVESIEKEKDLGNILSIYNESTNNKKVNIKEIHKCVLSRLVK